jgi:glycosyltransferase involved in cell wall biosynthesis
LEAQKYSHLVIVCDDGSEDLTGEIAERMGAIVVHHEHNRGYGAAMHSLFRRAMELNADVLVTLDSDGQHDPSEIPRLVKPIEDGDAEVVLGSRFKDKNGTADMPLYRQFGVKVITKLVNGSKKNAVSDAQSGFRAYGKRAQELLGRISENGMSASIELLRAAQKNGLKICEVPISCKYSNGDLVKTSKHNPLSHGMGLLSGIVKLVIEEKPVLYLGMPGILCLLVGAVFGIWMLELYAIEHQIATNIALASLSFILFGFFAMSTAITLYAISRIMAKVNGKIQ